MANDAAEPIKARLDDTTTEATAEELEAEISSLRQQLERAEAKRAVRTRSTLSVVLVVLTAFSVIAATVGFWMHDVVFDTDSFMEIVEPSITSDEFTAVISDRVADEAIAALDLRARLELRLGAVDQYLQEALVDALDPSPAAVASAV